SSLSSSVLQGFTCTSIRTFQKTHINNLIKACRRKGNDKVTLVESQLTCMSYYIQNSSDVTDFSLIPQDVLLYYQYSSVPVSRCRDYFQQLADADFSVFSSALSYKKTELFTNAKSCLGINSTSLTQEQVSVLGNMCCTLQGSYIQDSDPSILEKLKNCPDLTEEQAAAVQTLLESGNTPYGAPSTWNLQTLKDLGMLPLYLQSSFYQHFNKVCSCLLLSAPVCSCLLLPGCTVGEIDQVTISDETFPFDYTDIQQFNSCLSATTVKDNLDTLTIKLDEEDYLRVVLDKLNEVRTPLKLQSVQVQLLGPASRVSTAQDISHWTITELDTLSALMSPSDGQWNAQQVISRYLSTPGNSLGSAELNAVGGENLCSLDPQVLKNILPQSLRSVLSTDLDSSSSSSSSTRSSTRSSVPVSTYQLMQPYLGTIHSALHCSITLISS
uniref:Mesothelin a n=1 Tax=Periophthalmus magnuspinnatus TaxID=409849 RepID=A0A3B4AB41_9GOBI